MDFAKIFGNDGEDEDEEEKNKKHSRKRNNRNNEINKEKKNGKKLNHKKRKNYSTSNQKSEKTLLSDNFVIPPERRISIDVSKFKLERKKYNKENDEGNVEYKLKLCNVSKLRFEELKTGMNFRIREGYGECFYEIGVEDNGNDLGITQEELTQTLSLLNFIATDLGCQAKITKLIEGKQGYIAELYIRDDTINKTEITIGVLGEEGTGKSTLIGVLKNGKLDNGAGSARSNILIHKHEITSGKTSSFSHQILGFDEKGDITNYDRLSTANIKEIVHKSTKIINFYDMAGSAKTFNRTTLSNLSNEYLDCLLFVISAKNDITEQTKNLLRFSYNIGVPIITIISKIDLIKEEELKNLIENYKNTINKLNEELNESKEVIFMQTDEDVEKRSRKMNKKIILTFLLSNLKWEGGLGLFRNFLRALPEVDKLVDNERKKKLESEKLEFDVHGTIFKEKKSILIGMVTRGKLKLESKYYLGPDSNGDYKLVQVNEIHSKKIEVPYSFKGQYCSVSVKSLGNVNTLTKEYARKGMCLLEFNEHLTSSKLFEIQIWTIDHTRKKVKNSYQPFLHIKHVGQPVKIKNPDEIYLFLSDNKKENDLEKLLDKDDVNLNNVQNKLKKLIEKKKHLNKKDSEDKKEIKNIKVMKNENGEDNNLNNSLLEFDREIIIGPVNEKTKLLVEFLFSPEYISVGQKIIINDQSMKLKAFGVVTKILK
jgi:elongation factor 1-alpha